MGRVFKWLLIGLAGLVGTVLVFVVLVLLLVDPNDYRDQVAALVERQTGREVAIEGDLGLTFFPWLGLQAGGVRVADAEGFGPEPFLRVQQLTLAVQVAPLIGGDLVVDTVVLDRAELRLIRDEQGRANWETILASPEPAQREGREPARDGEAEPPAPETPEQREAPGPAPAELPPILRNAELAGLRLRQAQVRFEDRQAGTAATVDPLNIGLEDVQLGQPVQVSSDWQATLDAGPSVTGRAQTALILAPDLASAEARDLAIDLTASGDAMPAGKQTASLRTQVTADLAKEIVSAREIRLEAAGMAVTGHAEARLTPEGPVVTGMLEVPETAPRSVMQQLAIEPPATRDGKALQRLSATVTFRVTEGLIELKPLKLVLDESTVNGEALIRDPTVPAVDFDLAVDTVNVDRYLPPETGTEEQEPPPATPGEAAASSAAQLPTDTLQSLDLNGRVRVAELVASGARASEVDVTVGAEEGRIRLHPLTAKLYEGSYEGDVQLDATGDVPQVSVNERLSGARAQPLLTDLSAFDRLLGTTDVALQASTRGRTMDALVQGLQGEARFEFRDGAVTGINVARSIREAYARLQGQSDEETAADETKRTDFTVLGGTVTFDGPVVRNDDLNAQSPLLRVQGEGEANWLQRTLDYRLTVNVVGSLEGQGGASLGELRGIPIPLRLHGTLTEPEIDIAIKEALATRARRELEEKETELRERATEELEEKEKELRERAAEELEEERTELEEKRKELEGRAREELKEELEKRLENLFRD